MSEYSTTIRINDGFTEPLKNLAKAAYNAQSPLNSLKEAIAEVNEETDYQEVALDSLFYAIDQTSKKVERILSRQFKLLKKQTRPLMKYIKKSLPKELKNLEKSVENTAKSFIKAAKNTGAFKASVEKLAKMKKSVNFKVTEAKFAAANLRANSIIHGGYGRYARDVFAEKSPRAARFVKRTYESASNNAKIAREMIKEFGIKDTAKAYKSLIGQKLSGTKFSEGFSKGQAKFTELENLVKGRTAYWKNVADINGVGKAAQAFGSIQKIRVERAVGSVLNKIQSTSGVQAFMKAQARGGGVFRSLSSAGKAVWYDDIKTSKGFKFAQKEFAEFKKFSSQKLDIMRREVAFKATSAKMSLKIAMDEFKWRTAFLKTDLLHAKNVAIQKGRQGLEIAKNFIDKQKAIIDKKGLSWYINDISKGPKGKGIVGAFRRNIFDPRKGIIDRAKDFGNVIKKNTSKAAKYVKKTPLKKMIKDFEGVAKKGISNGFKAVANSGPGKFFGGFIKDFGKMFGIQMLSKVIDRFGEKLKEKIIEAGNAMVEAISNSMDELTLTDKFSTMYGNEGKIAQRRAYDLANELGMNATSVGEMSMRAAKEGIGTDEFDTVMRLSDKIASLSTGETTADVANNLMANLKSNHDAGSLAQMLGGGEVMERKIRRSGYERALNRGDLKGALKIAEEITKQAGFTDEKYAEATDTMSRNFNGIANNVENIKKRVAEVYVRGLEPVVKRIKEIMDSPQFKKLIEYIVWGAQKIGEVIGKIMMSVIGNAKLLGVLFGVGVALKLWLCVVHLKQTVGLVGFLVKAVSWLGKTGIGRFIAGQLKSLAITIKEYTLRKAMKKLLKGGLIVGAVLLVAKILHHLFGEGKSFMEFMKGTLFGIVGIVIDLVKNVGIAFKRAQGKFAAGIFGAKKLILELITDSKQLILDTTGKVLYKIVDLIEGSVIGDLLDKGLGVNVKGAADDIMKKLNESIDVEENRREIESIDRAIQDIAKGLPDYVDPVENFAKSIETNGQSVIDEIKKLSPKVGDIAQKVGGVAGDTNKIRKYNEQEEELRWLKAFSDRQIMSMINQSTSNVSNVTFNNLPTIAVKKAQDLAYSARATRNRMLI